MNLLQRLWRRSQPSCPLVSVVVASYNHAPFVQDCLRSALQQELDGELEIVVTDDGSTDGTPERIAELNDPRIHLHVLPTNQGACAATNHALRRARGQYIAILNSDDQFLPGKLQAQLNCLQQHPKVGAVFGWPTFINEQGQPFTDAEHKDYTVFQQPNRTRHAWLRHFFDQGNALCHPTVLIRREVYDTVGLYDPRLAQVPDLDQWMRVCMRYDIHIMPQPLTAFRIRSGLQNASAARPEVVRRDAWERAYILRHYLRLPPAELLQVFPEFSATAAEPLVVQLARHAIALGMPFYQRFGLDAWFDALATNTDPAAWRHYIAATGSLNPHNLAAPAGPNQPAA
jgi:hypothetical protein